ncbi:unnamed protein product [Peronospora belbahrii]|uniref:WW domain-containing protein n=2 Tax=Peronospora belbahrii TaxID=622444 RepID=A0ABN8CNM7_9STRA|nr:unnamed protein product [Peronospora belbahrii]
MVNPPRKARHDDDIRHMSMLKDGWEQFTSPEGHLYYYNSDTKESKWEYPFKEKKAVSSKSMYGSHNDTTCVFDQDDPVMRSEHIINDKSKRRKKKKKNDEQKTEKIVTKPSNVMVLKLQASLGEKLGTIQIGRPPMLNLQRDGVSDITGNSTVKEIKTSLIVSLEDQYEAETAGMSAAERLRFLRRKRQENMMSKRESFTGDDFMTEVANNMKKKGVIVRRKEGHEDDEKIVSWEKQEKAEEERKRKQMEMELEAKKQEIERKKRQIQVATEREEQREQEHAEQLKLERRKQEQEIENRKKQKNKEKKTEKQEEDDEVSDRNASPLSDCHRASAYGHVQNHFSAVGNSVYQDDKNLDVSLPERAKHTRNSQSQGNKHGTGVNKQPMKHVKSVEDDHLPANDRLNARTGVNADTVQDEKRDERSVQKQRMKDMLVASTLRSETSEFPRPKSTSSLKELNEEFQTCSTSTIDVDEDAKVSEKQLRRERRRMKTMKAALAAQNLNQIGDQDDAQPAKSSEPHTDSRNGPTLGFARADGSPTSEQPLAGQPPLRGEMNAPYPYMMMSPPPSSCGYYYPYMQPYSMPLPLYPPVIVPPGYQSLPSAYQSLPSGYQSLPSGYQSLPKGYQSLPPTPPHSTDGVAAALALTTYGTDLTLANAYGYDMNFGGIRSGLESSTCDCCKGTGVGLVEKNGVCAHCNRLRLAFIVDSAQMRLRCSVCGGWGFRLLQANGMCQHCTRNTAQKSLQRLSAARRPSSVASTIAAAQPRQTSAATKLRKDGFNDIDWDQSSSDDSDWDD